MLDLKGKVENTVSSNVAYSSQEKTDREHKTSVDYNSLDPGTQSYDKDMGEIAKAVRLQYVEH